MGYGLSPVMRSGRAPVAAVASPGDAGFWIRGVWGDAYDEADGGLRAPRQGRAAAGTRCAPRARPRAWPSRWPTSSRPTPSTTASTRSRSSVAYPEDSDFGQRLRYLAAMISQPLGIRVADVQADGDFDTHDDQAELTTLLGEVSECLSALPGRPRGARGREPGADLRVVGVRAAARGRTTAAPTMAPAGSRGSRATGRSRACTATTRTSPPRLRRQPAGDDRLPRASTRACSSSTWAPTPAR